MHAQFFSRFPLSNFSCDCVYIFIVVFTRFPGIFYHPPSPCYPYTLYLILFYRISIREIGCSNFNDIHITGFVLLLFFLCRLACILVSVCMCFCSPTRSETIPLVFRTADNCNRMKWKCGRDRGIEMGNVYDSDLVLCLPLPPISLFGISVSSFFFVSTNSVSTFNGVKFFRKYGTNSVVYAI